MAKRYLIGVTGGSGSGKTLFVNRLVEAIGQNKVTVVSQDNYYWPIGQQPRDSNGRENFDLPDSFDSEQFASDVAALQNGETVRKMEHVFNNPKLVPRELVFEPAPVIIIEGIFVLHFPEVASKLDLKLYVDARDLVKVKRRILRDNAERGYDLDAVLYQYEHHVMPSYEKYIAPHKHSADLIVCNDARFDRALEVIKVFVNSKLGRQ